MVEHRRGLSTFANQIDIDRREYGADAAQQTGQTLQRKNLLRPGFLWYRDTTSRAVDQGSFDFRLIFYCRGRAMAPTWRVERGSVAPTNAFKASSCTALKKLTLPPDSVLPSHRPAGGRSPARGDGTEIRRDRRLGHGPAPRLHTRLGSSPPSPFAQFADQVRTDPKWQYFELPCGHNAMLDLPGALIGVLLGCAARTADVSSPEGKFRSIKPE
jgi:hypothetical protein